jgi:hypothetical protein
MKSEAAQLLSVMPKEFPSAATLMEKAPETPAQGRYSMQQNPAVCLMQDVYLKGQF